MTPDYVPDPTRFYNHQDDLISFMAMMIAMLILYIVWDKILVTKERNENRKTFDRISESFNKLSEAVHDKK